MRKIPMFFLLLCLILVSGCGKASPPQETNPGANVVPPPSVTTAPSVPSYFPFTQGSTWSYEGQGNEFASFTREVTYVQNNQGQFKESNGGTVSTQVFQVTDTGVTRLYFRGEDYDASNLLAAGFTANDASVVLKTPLQVGTTWTSGNIEKRIVAVDATVTTPAGKFESCIQVEARNTDSVVSEYFKAGIGMVKREFRSGNETISSSLDEYKIMP